MIRTRRAVLAGLGIAAVWGAPEERLEFEVASVKPADPASFYRQIQFLTGGRLVAERVHLSELIEAAYDLKDFQVVGGPSWVSSYSDHYDVRAKAEGAASESQMKRMLQTLLADRFQLKLHHEMRAVPVYALVIDKLERLQTVKENDQPRGSGAIESVAPGFIRGKNIDMKNLARSLNQHVDHPVLDQTHFSESIDFELKWTPGQSAADAPGPSIFDALQRQMGLKLEAVKGPIDVVVVDSAERPSEN